MLWGRYDKKSKYYFLYKQKQKSQSWTPDCRFCPVTCYIVLELLFISPPSRCLPWQRLLAVFSWVSEQTTEYEDWVLIQTLLLGFDDVLGRHPLCIEIANSSAMPYFQTHHQKLKKDLNSSLTVGPERSTCHRIVGNICYLNRVCSKCLTVT